jgi:hypothetical protein
MSIFSKVQTGTNVVVFHNRRGRLYYSPITEILNRVYKYGLLMSRLSGKIFCQMEGENTDNWLSILIIPKQDIQAIWVILLDSEFVKATISDQIIKKMR